MQFTLGETHVLSLLHRVPELKPPVPLDWHQTPPVLVLIKSVLEVQDKFAGEQILSLEYVQRGLLVPTAIDVLVVPLYLLLALMMSTAIGDCPP